MGGLVKGVKKVFKAVGGFVKKYWKPILIAAAIYFTAGIALAAMPATASFAAAMPGFGATGIFSSAATAIGFGGAEGAANVAAGYGIFGNAVGAAGAAAAGTTALAVGAEAPIAAETGLSSAVSVGAPLGGLGAEGTGTAGLSTWGAGEAAAGGASTLAPGAGVMLADTAPSVLNAAATGAITNSPAEAGGFLNTAKNFWSGMSSSDKAMFGATVFKGISGLLAPGPTKAQQGLWPGGAFFGMDEKGKGVDLGQTYANAQAAPVKTATSTSSGEGGDAEASASTPLTGAAPAPTPALAAGGDTSQAQPQQPSPAASAQTGSSFLPTAGTGAATAQQATQTQEDSLQRAGAANADFIQQTMARLDPRNRNASNA
jgi:hypothetical protein